MLAKPSNLRLQAMGVSTMVLNILRSDSKHWNISAIQMASDAELLRLPQLGRVSLNQLRKATDTPKSIADREAKKPTEIHRPYVSLEQRQVEALENIASQLEQLLTHLTK